MRSGLNANYEPTVQCCQFEKTYLVNYFNFDSPSLLIIVLEVWLMRINNVNFSVQFSHVW